MSHLVLFDGKAYLVDLDSFRKSMFEPLPMTTLPPPIKYSDFYFPFKNYAPVIRQPGAAIIIDSIDDGAPAITDPWEFHYLFPLGKRGYVKRK